MGTYLGNVNELDYPNHFIKEKYSNLFLLESEKFKNQLLEHRKRNFIGSMLNYHTIKSSKYLSKWIEEKNKQN